MKAINELTLNKHLYSNSCLYIPSELIHIYLNFNLNSAPL